MRRAGGSEKNDADRPSCGQMVLIRSGVCEGWCLGPRDYKMLVVGRAESETKSGAYRACEEAPGGRGGEGPGQLLERLGRALTLACATRWSLVPVASPCCT